MSREEQIARNEVLFREVNERVRETRPEEGEERIAFLCECGNEDCTESVSLSVAEYEAVRSDPTHFVVFPGHEILDLEEPMERTPRFVVVRKIPAEASGAIDTDPRA